MEAQTKKSKFYVYYDGPAHKNHEMDIDELSKRLRNLGQLLTAANTKLNGDVPIDVKVKAGFQEGSIGWEVEVFQQIIANHKDIVAYLGFGAAAATATLFEVMEKVKGRKVLDIVKSEDGSISRVLVDEEEIECDEDIAELLATPQVLSAIDDLAYQALKDEGTTLFAVKESPTAKTPLVSVDRPSRASYKARKKQTTQEAGTPFETPVTFLTGHVDSKKGWRVDYLGTAVPVTIEDEAFFAGIPEGEIPNILGQKFTVRLRIDQTVGPGTGKDKDKDKKYIIEKVFHKSVA